MTEGRTALFHCRHPTADIIGWRINGTSPSSFNFPVSDVVSSIEGEKHTLSINARSIYNGSIVECVAIFLDGQQQQISTAAVLIIQS